MISLRTDDDVDHWRAALGFGAFGLGDAAGDRDGHAAAVARRVVLQYAHAAEFGIDLLGRLLADVAGVEDDEVGVVRRRGLDKALGGEHVRHTMRIVDVHLAAVGLDVEFSGHAVADEFPIDFKRL